MLCPSLAKSCHQPPRHHIQSRFSRASGRMCTRSRGPALKHQSSSDRRRQLPVPHHHEQTRARHAGGGSEREERHRGAMGPGPVQRDRCRSHHTVPRRAASLHTYPAAGSAARGAGRGTQRTQCPRTGGLLGGSAMRERLSGATGAHRLTSICRPSRPRPLFTDTLLPAACGVVHTAARAQYITTEYMARR